MEKGIWLLRHGAVEANPEHRFVGQRDVKLSSLGIRQYERLAARLVERCQDNPPKAFFCSDLSRSMACAEILRRAFRPSGGTMPIVLDPALRESSLGAWEGLTKAEVEKRYPGALAERAADCGGWRRRPVSAWRRGRSASPGRGSIPPPPGKGTAAERGPSICSTPGRSSPCPRTGRT